MRLEKSLLKKVTYLLDQSDENEVKILFFKMNFLIITAIIYLLDNENTLIDYKCYT